jgi:hypothetical protein
VRNVEMSNLEQEINSSIEKCSIYVCRSINNMHVGKNVYESVSGTLLQQKNKGTMQGRILNIWALGQSSMQRKQTRGRATTLSKTVRKEVYLQ